MHPSVPDPGPAGDPRRPPRADPERSADQGVAGVGKPEWTDDSAGTEPWPTPPPAPAWTEQPRSDQPWAPPTWTPPPGEQRTTQLPRNTDAGRFPYPAPAPPPSSSPAEAAASWSAAPTPPQTQVPPASFPPAPGPSAADSYQPGAAPPADPPPTSTQKYQPQPRGSHLPPYSEPFGTPAGQPPAGPPGAAGGAPTDPPTAPRTGPRKLTVTRVAAFRSRELTTRGAQIFHAAATADGADRSGLTALTYAVMGNYAVDAALAVALANTLFFAAATAESTGKVLLYLLITVAPFAVIAPLIGPALDKLQHGRRIALGASSFARAVLAVVMALNFDSWVLYPCALGMLVLSKSFSVLKAAITPRVLPPDITLVKTNSRLTVFGLMAGGVAGALAAGLSWAFGSTGALILTGLLSVVGGLLCLRIPSWVESTAGEIPVDGVGPKAKRAFPLSVTTTLWANGTIRVETGFLALFVAFVIKREYTEASAFTQLLLLGVVGVAAGIGGFIGNGLGAKLALSKPETVSIWALAATATSTLIAVLIPSLATAALVGLVGSTASSLAKVCLDSVIQHELPEASRASAFGLSETVLQLSWVFGGVIGLLIGGVWTFGLDSVFSIGFAVITVLLVIGLIQSWLVRSGRSLFPWLDYSKLTKHFRRSGRGAAGPTSAVPQARDAGRPASGSWNQPPTTQPPTAQPPTTQLPWQPGGSGQAWQNAPPTGGWSYPPTGYGPPTGARPLQGPPPGYPPPGYQAPGGPTPSAGPGQPPQQQPHPPPRDAGSRRKWTRGK